MVPARHVVRMGLGPNVQGCHTEVAREVEVGAASQEGELWSVGWGAAAVAASGSRMW